MSDGMLHSFWNTLQRAEQSVEAEARDAERSLYRTLYGYESRVMRLRWALEASGPLARKEIAGKLEHVSLDAVWPILLSIVKDIALYYGGSVVLGTAVGAGVGALFFGAGAIPGAALGFEAGMVLGEWVMMYLGLKMLAEGLVDTIPPAMNCYAEGFRAAWGPTESDRPDARYTAGYAPSKETAAQRFAQGHVLMIMAILIAIVAYLMRGKSEKALLKAVGDSKRLGSKMADWLEENEKALLKEKELQPKMRQRPEEAKEETSQADTRRAPGNTSRGPSQPKPSGGQSVATNSAIKTSASPPQLVSGQAAESQQLAALNSTGKVPFTPTPEQVNSSAFKTIVGEAKYTKSGDLVGTIYDGVNSDGLAEIKTGSSMLDSSYQLRLQTYGALVNDTPLTIYTSRPVNAAFQDYLTRWGVSVQPLPK
jgi:hypothetical protein